MFAPGQKTVVAGFAIRKNRGIKKTVREGGQSISLSCTPGPMVFVSSWDEVLRIMGDGEPLRLGESWEIEAVHASVVVTTLEG